MVNVLQAGQAGQLDVLDWQTEPSCWRRFSGMGGTQTIRPDAFLSLGVGAYELRWFCEIDRSTESLPTLLRKCRLYADYYQSGVEQARHDGVFPRVAWVVPDEARAARLCAALAHDQRLPGGLFVVTTEERATRTLCTAHLTN